MPPHAPATAADARFWDRAARRYAASRIGDEAGYERTLARTRALLGPSDAVLEIGCGTGTTALRLAPHVGRILATDVSPEMIVIARERAAAAGSANAGFAVGAVEDAPEAKAPFDAVLAFNLLHLVHDRGAALRRVHGLLRPGGILVSKTPCLSEMNPLIRLLVPAMRLVGKAPTVAFFDAGALEREIVGAGFTIEERARHGSGRRDPRIFLVARRA